MRAFFCLELDSTLREAISKISSRLKRSDARVSWVRPASLHITLKFLGDISEDLIPKLKESVHHAIHSTETTSPVSCQFNQLGAFPNINRPRVVWVGCKEEPARLQALAKRLEESLAQLGFEPERGGIVTHVTLGRVKEEGAGVARLVQSMQKIEPFSFPTKLDHITLMKSDLTPEGSIYTPVFQVPFSTK
ncbi:RNA 2',3'-cyclic phosphodiesterase [Candidatus Acetothermia bacterium]|nr:RNA 2',3'-cyclic phosphodiesterase [Candidatus Acetothermia bacterium]MBI3643316.1 RNA 2',3'-cyclic phosphodiesterase [Candidatus Acetothermia bacterium]